MKQPPPELISRYLEVCPEFRRRWDEHLAYWKDEERGTFIDLAEVVHFIVDSYSGGQLDIVQRALTLTESLLAEDDPETNGLVTYGLLETLQTHASHKPYGSDVFEKFLGPISMQAWREIELDWQGKRSLAEVIRAEKSSKDDG
ncbi:MAG: hypothetical protein MJE12_24620 [Alphaproteobacteria bacterium]|nr:hypothetical protein [Alphaproteobacteria bacterium]